VGASWLAINSTYFSDPEQCSVNLHNGAKRARSRNSHTTRSPTTSRIQSCSTAQARPKRFYSSRRCGSTYTIENEAALDKYRSDTNYKLCEYRTERERDERRKQSKSVGVYGDLTE
jgi:hypothetical protein